MAKDDHVLVGVPPFRWEVMAIQRVAVMVGMLTGMATTVAERKLHFIGVTRLYLRDEVAVEGEIEWRGELGAEHHHVAQRGVAPATVAVCPMMRIMAPVALSTMPPGFFEGDGFAQYEPCQQHYPHWHGGGYERGFAGDEADAEDEAALVEEYAEAMPAPKRRRMSIAGTCSRGRKSDVIQKGGQPGHS